MAARDGPRSLLNTKKPAIRQRPRSLPHKLSAQPPAARRVYVPMTMPTLWKIAHLNAPRGPATACPPSPHRTNPQNLDPCPAVLSTPSADLFVVCVCHVCRRRVCQTSAVLDVSPLFRSWNPSPTTHGDLRQRKCCVLLPPPPPPPPPPTSATFPADPYLGIFCTRKILEVFFPFLGGLRDAPVRAVAAVCRRRASRHHRSIDPPAV